MRIDVSPLDFTFEQGYVKYRDSELWQKAEEYMQRELVEPFDPTKMAKSWVAHAEGEVCGITAFQMIPDITHFRVSGPNAARATKMMTDRLQSYFADQGLRGGYVFLYISGKEKPEQRCHRWEESLQAAGAVPADRMLVKVR